MKKSLLMKTMLLLFALVTGSTCAWAADTWEETALSDLTSTDVFVIVGNNGSTYAMTNDNGTTKAPVASAVTVTGNKITSAVADNIQWNISGNATDGYTFYPNGSTTTWLYCTNSNNGIRVGTNSAKTFKVKSGYLQHAGTSRYVGIYNSQDWRCYTTNGGNIENQTFKFYKKVAGSSKKAAGLSFAISSYEVAPNTIFSQVVTNPNSLAVTYASDDEDIAYVDPTTGEVLTGDKIGTATITASSAETASYDAGEASYTITVFDATANDGTEAKPYTVTEALALIDALADGGKTQSVYVKGTVSTGLSNIVNDPSKSYDGAATYYISADGTTSSQLMIYRGYNIAQTKFTAESDLSVGDEVVVFGSLYKYVKNNVTTPEFASGSCITQLKHGSEPEVKSLDVAAAEYRTYVATANLVVPTGVKAYIATGETASTLTLTSVAKIKEGTPVILNAAEGYYTFEITDDAVTYPATNLLKISDGTAVNGVFVLAKSGDNVGFYKWMGGALSAGRVYVDAPANAARDYLEFTFEESDVTAISEVTNTNRTNEFYDLQGRKVAQPTKGLYIVNGRKVIIK